MLLFLIFNCLLVGEQLKYVSNLLVTFFYKYITLFRPSGLATKTPCHIVLDAFILINLSIYL